MSDAVETPAVTVEFFGMARQKAERSEITVQGRTLAEVLASVQRAFPALGGLLQECGQINNQYLVSIDGREFLTELGRVVERGNRIVILGADVGG
jgi:molybdopterin converting factor small subunit